MQSHSNICSIQAVRLGDLQSRKCLIKVCVDKKKKKTCFAEGTSSRGCGVEDGWRRREPITKHDLKSLQVAGWIPESQLFYTQKEEFGNSFHAQCFVLQNSHEP